MSAAAKRAALLDLVGRAVAQDDSIAVGGLLSLSRDLDLVADHLEVRKVLQTHWTDDMLSEHIKWLAIRARALAELAMAADEEDDAADPARAATPREKTDAEASASAATMAKTARKAVG